MWGRLSNLAQTVQGITAEDEESLEGGQAQQQPSEASAGGSGDDPLGPDMDKGDLHDQYTQQQKLILQLKAMIRERGEVLETRDKEIKELNAKLSKQRLQAKSKIASLKKERDEARRVESDVLERSSVCSDESVCTVSSEMSTSTPDPALRGKLRLMKKKVQDLEKLLAEHSEQVKVRQQEVAAKEKVIGERDEVIESLTRQLQVQIQAMDEMGPTRPQEGATVLTGDVDVDSESLQNKLVELEDEKGNLQLKIVELEESLCEQARTEQSLKEQSDELAFVRAQRDNLITHAEAIAAEKEALGKNTEELAEKVALLKNSEAMLEAAKVTLEVKMVELEEEKEASDHVMTELQTEVARLREKVEYERQPSIVFETENTGLQQKILELQGQVKDTEAKVEELEEKLSDCDTNLEKSERAGRTLTEEVDRLRVSDEATMSSLQSVKRDLDAAVVARDTFKDEASNLEDAFRSLQMNCLEKESELQTATATLERRDGDVASLETNLGEVRQQLSQREGQLEKFIEESARQQTAFETMRSDLEGATATVEDRDRETERLNAEKLESDNTQRSLQEVVELKDEKIVRLTLDLDDVSTRERHCIAQVSLLETELGQATRELGVIKDGKAQEGLKTESKVQSLLSQLGEVENEVSRQLIQIREQENSVRRLEGQLEAQYGETRTQREKIRRLEGIATKHVEAVESLEQRLSSTQDELVNTRGALDDIESVHSRQTQSQREEYDKIDENLRHQVAALQAETDRLQNVIVERENELKSSARNVDHVSNESVLKDKLIRDLRSELGVARGELEEREQSLRKTTEEKDMKITSLIENLEEMSLQFQMQGMRVDELMAQLQDACSIEEQSKDALVEKEGRIVALEESLTALQDDQGEQQTKLDKLGDAFAEKSREMETLIAEDSAEKSTYADQLRAQESKLMSVINDLKAKDLTITSLEVKLISRREQVEKGEAAIRSMRGELEQERKTHEDLSQTLNEKLEHAAQLIEELRHELAEKVETVTQLEKHVQEKDERMELLEREFQNVSRLCLVVSERDQEIGALTDELREVNQQLGESEQRESEAEEKVECLRKQQKDMEERAEEHIKKFVRVAEDREDQVETLSGELEGKKADVEHYRELVQQSEQAVLSLRQELATSQARSDEQGIVVDSLHQQVAALHDDIKQRGAVTDELRGELVSSNEQLCTRDQQVKSLQIELDERRAELQSHFESSTQSSDELQSALMEKNQMLNSLTRELGESHDELVATRSTNEEMSQRFDEVAIQLEHSKKCYEEARQAVENKDVEVVSLTVRVGDVTSQLDSANVEAQARVASILELQSRLEQLQAGVVEKDSLISRLMESVAESESQITGRNAAINQQNDQIDAMRQAAIEVESQLQQRTIMCETLQKLGDDSGRELTSLLQQRDEQFAGLTSDLHVKELRATAAEQRAAELSDDVQRMEAEKAQLGEQLEEFMAKLENSDVQIVQLRGALTEREGVVERTAVELAGKVSELDDMIVELQQARMDLEQLNLSVVKLRDDLHESRTQNEALEKEWRQRTTEQTEEGERQIAKMRQELENIKMAFDVSTDGSVKLIEQRERLGARVTELESLQESHSQQQLQWKSDSDQMAAYRQEMETSTATIADRDSVIERQKQDAEQALADIAALGVAIQDKDARLGQLVGELDEMSCTVRQKDVIVDELREELRRSEEKHEGDVKGLQESLERSDQQLKDVAHSFSDQDSTLAQLTMTIQQRNSQLEQSTKESQEMKVALSRAEERLEKMTGKHDEKMSSLADNLQDVDSQLTLTTEALETSQSELRQAETTVATMTGVITEKDKKTMTLAESLDEKETTLKKYLVIMKKQKLQMKRKDEESSSSLDKLRVDCEELRGRLSSTETMLSESHASQQEVENLTARLRTSEEETVKLKGLIELCTQDAESSSAKLVEAMDQRDQLSAGVENYQAEIERLNSELEDAVKCSGERCKEIELLMTQVGSLEEQLSSAQDMYRRTSEQIEGSERDKETQAVTLQLQHAEIEHASQQVIAELQAEVVGSEIRCKELYEQVEQFQTMLSDNKQMVEASEERISQASAEKQHLTATIEQIRADLHDREEDIRLLKSNDSEKDVAYSSMQERLNELQASLHAKEDEIHEKEKDILNSQDDVTKSNVMLSDLQLNFEGKTAEVSELSAALDAAHDEVISVGRSLQERVEHLCRQKAELETENAKLFSHADSLEVQVSHLSADLGKLSSENASLLEKCESVRVDDRPIAEGEAINDKSGVDTELAAKVDVAELKSDFERLQSELNVVHDRCSDYDVEIETMSNTISVLEDEKRNLSDDLRTAQTNLETLRDGHASLSSERQSIESAHQQLSGSFNALTEEYNRVKISEENLKGKLEEHSVENSEIRSQLERLTVAVAAKEREETLHTEVEVEPLQRAGSSAEEERQREHELQRLRNKLEVSEVKNGKLLNKLKQFKEKTDRLELQLVQTQTSAGDSSMDSEIEQMKTRLASAEMNRQALAQDLDRERERYRNLEAEYQGTAEELQLELGRQMQQLENSKEQHADLAEVHETTVAELRAATMEKTANNSTVDELRQQIEVLASEHETIMGKVTTERDSLRESLEELRADVGSKTDSVARQNSDLQQQYDMLSADNDNYQQLVEQLKLKTARLQKELREQTEVTSKLETEASELRHERDTIQHQTSEESEQLEDIQELQDEIVEVSANNRSLKRHLDKTEVELKTSENTRCQLAETIDGLNWKIQEFSDVEEELSQTSEKLFSVMSENGAVKKRLKDVESRMSELDALDRQHQSLNEQHARVLSDNTALIMQVEDMRTQVREMQTSGSQERAVVRDELESSITLLKSEVKTTRERNDALAGENASFESQLTAMKQSITEKRRDESVEHERLRQSDEMMERERQATMDEINLMREQSAKQQQRLGEFTQKVNQFEDERRQLQRQLNMSESELTQRSQQLSILQSQYSATCQQYEVLQHREAQAQHELARHTQVDTTSSTASPAVSGSSKTQLSLAASQSDDLLSMSKRYSFELSPVHLTEGLEQAEQVTVDITRESARIQQSLAAEREQRLHLEAALSHAEEQLKVQQQVTLQEFQIRVGDDEESLDTRRLLHPKTTLIRTARSHYVRLQNYLSSVTTSRSLRSIPRFRTALYMYLVVLHLYVMLGCFLGLL